MSRRGEYSRDWRCLDKCRSADLVIGTIATHPNKHYLNKVTKWQDITENDVLKGKGKEIGKQWVWAEHGGKSLLAQFCTPERMTFV